MFQALRVGSKKVAAVSMRGSIWGHSCIAAVADEHDEGNAHVVGRAAQGIAGLQKTRVLDQHQRMGTAQVQAGGQAVRLALAAGEDYFDGVVIPQALVQDARAIVWDS